MNKKAQKWLKKLDPRHLVGIVAICAIAEMTPKIPTLWILDIFKGIQDRLVLGSQHVRKTPQIGFSTFCGNFFKGFWGVL